MTSTDTPTPIAPNEIVSVTHYMRVELAPTFQRLAAEWLAAGHGDDDGTGDAAYSPPFARNHGPDNAWDLPEWGVDDHDAARWVLRDLSDNQRRVALDLIAAGTEGAWTKDLLAAAGYPGDTRASGVFRALSGRCRACGRRPFWNGGPKDSTKGQRLSVTEGATSDLFMSSAESEWPGRP